MKIKAVIGAAYGDEGKGLMTDFLCQQAIDEGRSPVVVRFNGGAQAGHTVVTPDDKRHVFHHFGSGSFHNIPTYLTEDFIVNPIVFGKEVGELKEHGIKGYALIHPHARMTTVFDMILNQFIEMRRHRTSSHHGSCGMGIFETIYRYDKGAATHSTRYGEFMRLEEFHQRDELEALLQNYFIPRAHQHLADAQDLLTDCLGHLENPAMMENFIRAVRSMWSNSTIDEHYLVKMQDHITVIFEGAQGLLLDQDYGSFPHVTPSNTGTKNILAQLQKMSPLGSKLDIEVLYLTRAYTTRHGAGPMRHELSKPQIKFVDPTNVHNPYQHTMRVAEWDRAQYTSAVYHDIEKGWLYEFARINGHTYKASSVMTCLDQAMSAREVGFHIGNERQVLSGPKYVEYMMKRFDYVSLGPTRESVWKIKHDGNGVMPMSAYFL